uniref:Uncharacterized protein n=2 Tax=Kalanchoe fedtschenkoi TaxID=63787 RepID=A0A7N0UK50_KALFE
MEPVALVVDKVKGAVESSWDFFTGVYTRRRADISRRNPIEILKRLQREAFSDLMKLRDRQDKVERLISYYNKPSKGSPFQEASTRVRGEVDILGAMLVMNNIDHQVGDVLNEAGVRTGINSRFTFETIVRQKDTVKTELVASQNNLGFLSDGIGSPLLLSKVSYATQVTDWLSANVIPVGARCRDIGNASDITREGKGFSYISSVIPPLMAQHCGGGIGVTAKKSNVTASLAQFVSGIQKLPGSIRMGHCLGTFGKILYQFPNGTKVSLSGFLQVPKASQHISIGPLTIPLGSPQHLETPYTSIELSSLSTMQEMEASVSHGSVALSLESQLDDCSTIGGWIEMQNSNPRQLQWAVSLSDSPENEMGWGLSVGGAVENHTFWDQFQVEAFLKLSIGETQKFSFQPGLVYMRNGSSHAPAIVLRSHCAL